LRRISAAKIGPKRFHQYRTVSWLTSIPRSTAGTIRVLGENPAAGEFAARRGLGYLPESVSFNAALTDREILTFYARLKGEPGAKSLELLDKVGLGAASTRRVGTYSKGMRQRLGLAQSSRPTTNNSSRLPTTRQFVSGILEQVRPSASFGGRWALASRDRSSQSTFRLMVTGWLREDGSARILLPR
jgi:hypothetical protein